MAEISCQFPVDGFDMYSLEAAATALRSQSIRDCDIITVTVDERAPFGPVIRFTAEIPDAELP
ncbi:hypothetical protein GCM10023147_20500 [Tsukamurella soli]|uniref:Uncharacterized protein n=2 Tax=Tsukamurella soli TaxID=644556 RepID=A0ABP8JIX0_9ACTN